jgi:PAS domain S-box-containing protein
MNPPLRILHLEDNLADALLVRDQLADDGLAAEIRHVSTRDEFTQALSAGKWNLVISDYKLMLPDFDGMDALKMVREHFPRLPFILMSGTIGEESAIESLKAGATDYVLKQNRDRLPSAVRRALTEAEERARLDAAEEELRRSEKQYRLLFAGNPHPMWVFDLESQRILEVNDAALQHYGYPREEFLGMTLGDLRATENGGNDKPSVGDTETSGRIWLHRRKDGTVMEMEVIWSPLAFRGHLAALTMATDVTVRRRATRQNYIFSKLSQNLSEATTAVEAARFICDAADDLFHWENFALDLCSATADEVVSLLNIATVDGRRVEIPPSPQPRAVNALIQRAITHGAELVPPEESGARPGTIMIAPIRRGEGVIGVLFIQNRRANSYASHDLETLKTLANQCGGALERVRAEEALSQSQRRFRELFENSPDAILVEDMLGNVLDVNPGACDLHGLTRAQLIGKSAVEDLLPPNLRAQARADYHKLASGQITWIESESLRADGRSVPVEIRVARIEYDGRPALLFHVRDITTRRTAEMALRTSEALFRSVWENSVDGMRLTDENGVMVAVNEAFCKLVGMTHEQLEGRPFTVVYSARTDWQQMLQRHRDHFHAGMLQELRERSYTLHDGRAVVLEIADSYVATGGKPRLLLSVFRDISSQKQLEEQLRQSQKMEAIGQLAGGIAHDFNNILTIVLGHASLLTMSHLEPRAQTSAEQIKQAAERAAGLTRQLLAFGRKQLFNPRPLDLNLVVGQMTDLLRRLLGEDIVLNLDFGNEPAIAEADASMIEQVLLNLSVNSRDAMPKGGQLTIRITTETVDEPHRRQYVEAQPGKFVCLSHTDTGCGIPPEIEVESELDHGTTFKIYLPATAQPPVDQKEFNSQFIARGGTETILVVEDERDLRDIITRTLNRHGYRVFQAVDGQNALHIWNEYKQDIDLLFTDLVMPGGLNGGELAERLRTEKPQLKVIYSSGYGAETLGRNIHLDPEVNYLQKPYLPQMLARIVRRCLDGKQA